MTTNTSDCCQTNPTAGKRTTPRGRTIRPAVEIFEDAGELTITADMPGLNPADIDIHFDRGELTVCGAPPANEPGTRTALFTERVVGEFARRFRVSDDIDGERIAADYKDGVLTLRLPKAEASKPRKVTVNAE